jgi:hypothetical protein
MIKKSVFEDDLIAGMQRSLAESELQEGISSLPTAVDYINSAIDIFEEEGMTVSADKLLSVLLKIAQKHCKPQQKPKVNDRYSPKNSNEMIKNLLDHGTVFNNTDDGNDVLNVEVDESDPNFNSDPDSVFEDE